jgi:putative oxidoreductase
MDQMNFALLLVRVFFGVSLAYHGFNKVFGGGGLAGTARWFGSLGMKWPALQARLAATTEIGAGVLFAVGLLTPLAAAAMVSLMCVAAIVDHRKNGFFIFKNGWEYVASIAVVAVAVATVGPGEWSLDHALEIGFDDWTGLIIAVVIGLGGAATQLAVSYRRPAAT